MVSKCVNEIKLSGMIKTYDTGKPEKKGYSFCPAPRKAGSKSFIDTDMLDVAEEPSPDFVSKECQHYAIKN
jgi:hypothetical protein